MANWHPMSTPHTNHNAARYWGGVAQLAEYSNFEQPRVSNRDNFPLPPGTPPSYQPGVNASILIDNSPAAGGWRPDEHGVG